MRAQPTTVPAQPVTGCVPRGNHARPQRAQRSAERTRHPRANPVLDPIDAENPPFRARRPHYHCARRRDAPRPPRQPCRTPSAAPKHQPHAAPPAHPRTRHPAACSPRAHRLPTIRAPEPGIDRARPRAVEARPPGKPRPRLPPPHRPTARPGSPQSSPPAGRTGAGSPPAASPPAPSAAPPRRSPHASPPACR
jgi:hypothetical protein